MIDVARRIQTIQALLEEGSNAALTYAALECRLTIEQVCYDRLKMSYGHISYDDLRKWQPKDVVRQIVEDANEFAASGFTLSISKTPVASDSKDFSKEGVEALEYVEIGEQVAVDVAKLDKLWNALSNVALHVKLPEKKGDDIRAYGSAQDIKEKVLAALKGLEALKSGTLLAGGIGTNYFFPCITCGTEIRRIEKLLKHGQVINCINPSCNETYLIHKDVSGTFHTQRTAQLKCDGCGEQFDIPLKLIDQLGFGNILDLSCKVCSEVNRVRLVPVQDKQEKTNDAVAQ